jgi:hypothetical protein
VGVARKTLFPGSSESSSSQSFASFSGLAELSATSSIPTFKKPLGPSTKLTRTKKLQDKRRTGSFVGRTPQNEALSSSSSFLSTTHDHPPVLSSSCEDLTMKRASRAQSFSFGDRSALSPLDLDDHGANLELEDRDLSPYSNRRSVGSCPTSRRASAASATQPRQIPKLLLAIDQMDDGSSASVGKENIAPRGASPYRPPASLQELPSSPSGRPSRSGSLTDRSHLRRHSIALLASDEPYSTSRPSTDTGTVEGHASNASFHIHHRPAGLASSSSAIATSPFNSSTSSSVVTSPFSAAADIPAPVAAPSVRRIKTRNCRSLTMSCGSLPTLNQFCSSSSSLSSSTTSLPPLSMPGMREAHVPVLPTNPHASHSDLPCIEPTTLHRLLRGEFDSLFSRLYIIDCRFKYEYDGGHIRGTATRFRSLSPPRLTTVGIYRVGALNLNTTYDVEKHFMLNPIPLKEKVCIIFHCEFSSHRGPVLYAPPPLGHLRWGEAHR